MAEGTSIFIPSLSRLSYSEEASFNNNAGDASLLDGLQTNTFGILGEDIKLPDPEVEMFQHRNVGSGANLHVIQPAARRLSGSLPITLQNGGALKYLLGGYSVVGTDPYTHSISCSDAAPASMCMEAIYNNGTDDFLRYFTGVVVTGGSITAEEEGFLKANMEIEAAMVAASTTETPSSVTQLETEPYVFCEGVATYFGSTYARVLDFNVNVKRAFKARRYIQSTNACYPKEINFGPRDIEMTTTIVAADDVSVYGTEYYKELLDPSSGGSTMKLLFTRGASDTIEIEITGVMLKSAPHGLNPSAEDYPISLELVAKDINIEIIDSISTY